MAKYVGLRQGECWERTENSNYYCGGCGWKVTDHDSYCPECGGALHKAALDSSNCTNSERTDAPRLPHFWTHDGALHVEAKRMPTRIVVCEGGTCEFVPKRGLDASEAENAKLRERIDAAHMSRLLTENENESLRELVRRYVEYTSYDRCEGCVVKLRCDDGEANECWQLTEIRRLAQELGLEVD